MSDKLTVFISYSRDDRKWKEILYPYLKARALADHLVLWDDSKIDMELTSFYCKREAQCDELSPKSKDVKEVEKLLAE